MAVGDHGDVARLEGSVVPGGVAGEQGVHVVGQVAGHVGPDLPDGERLGAAPAELVASDHPQPERRVPRRTRQPPALVVGRDVVDHDARVPEGGAPEHGLERGEQVGVAAPVDRERLLGQRGVGGVEVGDHVAAPEGVDRLLGVADQDHRRVAPERPVEDLPLHGVGVLELVDQHDPPALAHPRPGGGVVVEEGVGELAEQVVVGEDPQLPLAALELGTDRLGERDPQAVGGLPPGVGGLDAGLRVGDRGLPRDGQRLGVGEGRLALAVGEGAQVEVGDHLAEQLVEVLDQAGPGIGVAGDAQGSQDHRAELVGGRDGRGVEGGERLDDVAVGRPSLLVAAVAEQPHQVGGVVAGPVVAERAFGLDQLGTHPFAQLLARGPAERDDEHLVEPGDPLGDVAGDEGADGPGLAGAGARLQERGAGGQLATDVEGPGRGRRGRHSAATRSPPVSSGSHTVQAWSASPSARSRSSGARRP